MKFGVVVTSVLTIVGFVTGFVAGDIYRYFVIEAYREDGAKITSQPESVSVCSKGGLIAAEDISDLVITNMLAELWASDFENTFSVDKIQGDSGSNYRYFLNADIGGVVEFCQLYDEPIYFGIVDKSLVTIEDSKLSDHVENFSENLLTNAWVTIAIIEDNRAIGISNAFGIDTANVQIVKR